MAAQALENNAQPQANLHKKKCSGKLEAKMAENVPRNKKSGQMAKNGQVWLQTNTEPKNLRTSGVFFEKKKKQPANSTFVFKLQKERRQVKQD